MQLDIEATICGIATGQQPGRRGAIRISGAATPAVLNRCCSTLEHFGTSKRATRFSLSWDLGAPFGAIPVDAWYWPTSRSYTGMPSVELHTIGQPILLQRIVEQLCRAGCRLAMPGEFTLRAFLAGRMDLTQCEAVLGVIEAKSAKALDTALQQLAGGLSKPLRSLRSDLIELLADIEAGLDFVDEDIEFIGRSEIELRLSTARNRIGELLHRLHQRRSANDVAKVVLVGLPNAGKSSLFNALLGRSSAIVHDQAGTTRDFVRESLLLRHGTIELVDTAGYEEAIPSVDGIDSIRASAQSQRLEQAAGADLTLYCLAIDAPSDFGSFAVDSNAWLIRTKSDTPLERTVGRELGIPSAAVDGSTLYACPHFTSSRTGTGIAELRDKLDQWLATRNEEYSAVAPLTATRCVSLLESSDESLAAAASAAEHRHGDEIVSGEIRLALDALGQIAGEVYTDDVLDALFSRFCIGK